MSWAEVRAALASGAHLRPLDASSATDSPYILLYRRVASGGAAPSKSPPRAAWTEALVRDNYGLLRRVASAASASYAWAMPGPADEPAAALATGMD